MKFVYTDTQIQTLETLLDQVRVTGINQANILAMIGKLISQGSTLEEEGEK